MSASGPARARIALVVNPTAQKGRAADQLPEVLGRLRDAGHPVDVSLSRSADEAADLVAAAVATGPDVLAVMGGDGMAHLGLNAVAQHPGLALGLVPVGTGNDFARGLGLDPDDLAASVAVLAAGATRSVDLVRTSSRWVGTVVATGFDALVNARANRMSRPHGSARYTIAVLAEMRTFSPLEYVLEIDGTERRLDAMFVSVGNTSSFGGGLRICPAADPYDGWLDVTIIHPVGKAKLLQLLPRLKTGTFASDPCVEQLRARTIRIDGGARTAFGDGESLGPPPLTIESVPSAITICLPTDT